MIKKRLPTLVEPNQVWITFDRNPRYASIGGMIVTELRRMGYRLQEHWTTDDNRVWQACFVREGAKPQEDPDEVQEG